MAGVLIIGLDHQAAAMARLGDPATARIPGKNQVSSLQIRIKTTSPAAQGKLSSASELGQKSPVQPLEGPSMFGVASGRPAATTQPSPCSRTLCSGVYRKVHDQPGSLRLVLPRPQNPAVRCRGSRNVSKPSQRPAPPHPTHNTSSPGHPHADHAPGGNAWWPVPLASAGMWGARPGPDGTSTPGRPALGRSRSRRGARSGRGARPGYDISVCMFCIRANHQACRHGCREGGGDANPASFARVQAR
jgi:hypothetical protein